MTPATIFLAFMAPQAAAATYGFPTSAEDYSTFYETAYYDHGAGSALDDWNCGSVTYNGHTGNDFGVGSWSGMDAGRDITAAADGVVIAAHDGEFDRCSTGACGSANNVTIEHADGKRTYYTHMKKWSVQVVVGEAVVCGQKLGEVGSSGNSTGPHIHFGAYTSGGSIRDPFSGSCSSSTSYWTSQGSYRGLPSRSCDSSLTPTAPTAALIGWATDRRASTDINGDGFADVCARANAGYLCALGSASGLVPGPVTPLLENAGPLNDSPDHYASVRWGDVNGDKRDDLCVRTDTAYECYPSDGVAPVAVALPGAPEWNNTRGFNGMEHYSTARLLDFNGDGRMDLCIRGPDGLECAPATAEGFGPTFIQPIFRDSTGWYDPSNYATIRAGDVNGDGLDDICGRSGTRMYCYLSTGAEFDTSSIRGPDWSDDDGWRFATKYASIQVADINGDGMDDLFGRGEDGIHLAFANGAGFDPELIIDRWKDSSGWDEPDNAFTLRLADIDGDGDLDLCSRSNTRGIICGLWDGSTFDGSIYGADWDNTAGWDELDNHWSFSAADVNGDGLDDICGRDPTSGAACNLAGGAVFGDLWLAGWGADADGWDGKDNWPTFAVAGPRSPGCPDADRDFACDDADLCPLDPAKAAPGACGCGLPEGDLDGDGTCDARDGCPTDPAKVERGRCGCGVEDLDLDGDGSIDCVEVPDALPVEDAPESLDTAGGADAGADGAPAADDTAQGGAVPGDRVKLEPVGCAVAAPSGWGPLSALGALLVALRRRRPSAKAGGS